MDKRVTVIKVPAASNSGPEAVPTQQLFTRQKALPKMPQLYLELLENKDKIKQTLLSKEYDPSDSVSDISYFRQPYIEAPVAPLESRPSAQEQQVHQDDDDDATASVQEGGGGGRGSDWSDSSEGVVDRGAGHPDPHDAYSEEEDDGPHSEAERNGEDEDDNEDAETVWEEEEDEEADDDDEPGLSGRHRGGQEYSHRQREEYPKHPNRHQKYADMLQGARDGNGIADAPAAPAPKLSDLERMGHLRSGASRPSDPIYPELSRLQSKDNDREDEVKRELLFKFDLLRKGYKHVSIPEYTMNTDLRHLSRSYENTLRRVTLDSSVENYKSYMIGGFMLTEFLIQQWFQFDMQGFTKQQVMNMNQYERLFIELGEKSYRPGGSPWPVEVRILTTVLMNAVIFAVSKMILKKTGSDVMNMMGLGGGGSTGTATPPGPHPEHGGDAYGGQKRKMQGPSINFQDLPDI